MSGYISNIPLSNQSLGQTQPTINNNFTVLNTNMGADHVDFTFAAPPGGNGGRHNTVTLVQQSGDPAAVASAPILYTKSVTYAGPLTLSELFMRRASGDTGNVIQLSTKQPVAASNGSTFLPGGLMLQWGDCGTVLPTGTTVTFATAFPNNVLQVVVTVYQNGSNSTRVVTVDASTFSATTFKAYSSNNVNARYVAIGN